MKYFEEYNPIAVAVYFFSVTGAAMFGSHPLLMAICLTGGFVFFLLRNGTKHSGSHLGFLLLFIVLAAVNPLTSHKGETVLLVVNNSPITLEAVLFGLNSAAMAIGVIYWFRSFSQIMTSDKLLYITGRLSPKLSLILSMSMRFIPLFVRLMKRTAETQKALGLFREDNIIDSLRSRLRIFSITVTWALENSLTTAASMEARGCGTAKRTCYSDFCFTRRDTFFMGINLLLLGICIIGFPDFEFYPVLSGTAPDNAEIVSLSAYSVMAFLPIFIEMRATLKWKSLKSKI